MLLLMSFFFFKQKTAYELRISDWSSDVCSSDLKFGADGVHVGQEDETYAEARRILGADRIVGVTCHASRHLAMEAAEAGADSVALGAFFPTGPKASQTRADPDIIEWLAGLLEAPCVAIGGSTFGNCAPLGDSRAAFLAVSSRGVTPPEGDAG